MGRSRVPAALKHENSWGLRKMAYEINKRTEADYRWFRFEAPTELLDSLDHNLKIADGVLRFRIFKVDPDAPVIVPPRRPPPPTGPRERSAHGARDDHGDSAGDDADELSDPPADAARRRASRPRCLRELPLRRGRSRAADPLRLEFRQATSEE